jgi:hypothetical protein
VIVALLHFSNTCVFEKWRHIHVPLPQDAEKLVFQHPASALPNLPDHSLLMYRQYGILTAVA